jgi:hypothetical protein
MVQSFIWEEKVECAVSLWLHLSLSKQRETLNLRSFQPIDPADEKSQTGVSFIKNERE